jgi:hypothetical protein
VEEKGREKSKKFKMDNMFANAKSFALLPEDIPGKFLKHETSNSSTIRASQLLFRNRQASNILNTPEKRVSKSPLSLSPLKKPKPAPEQIVKESINLYRRIPTKSFAIHSINELKSLNFSLNPNRSEASLKRPKESLIERPNHILEEIYTRWKGEAFSQLRLNELVLEIEMKPQRYSYPVRKFSKKFLEDMASVLKGREILKDALINMHYNKLHAMGNYRSIQEVLKSQAQKNQKLLKQDLPSSVFNQLEKAGYLTISGSMNLGGLLTYVSH